MLNSILSISINIIVMHLSNKTVENQLHAYLNDLCCIYQEINYIFIQVEQDDEIEV